MAFPSIVDQVTTALDANTLHVPTLPGSNGGLLVVISVFDWDSASSLSLSASSAHWTSLFEEIVSGVLLTVRYRDSNGADMLEYQLDATEKSAHVCMRINGARPPHVQPPESSGVTSGFGLLALADALAPIGGEDDYLFIAASAEVGGLLGFSLPPLLYSGLVQADFGGSGSVRIAAASKQATLALETVGAFTLLGLVNWLASLIAVSPIQLDDLASNHTTLLLSGCG